MRSSFQALVRRFGSSLAGVATFAICLSVLGARCVRAQDFADNAKWEIGGHYATLNLPSQCATSSGCETLNNGFGGNLTYNFSSWLGLDNEVNFFGANGDTPTATTGGRVTEGLFGFRLGPTTRRWGLYSVVRPGFVNFGSVLGQSELQATPASTLFTPVAAIGAPQITARIAYQVPGSSDPVAVLGLTSATYFAFNYGEAIEYRPTKHAALRFDIGDTIVKYPNATLGTPLHQHNFEISEAIIIRF